MSILSDGFDLCDRVNLAGSSLEGMPGRAPGMQTAAQVLPVQQPTPQVAYSFQPTPDPRNKPAARFG